MALALLTGLGSAHADELGDLRANQQLLSQRVDQLAQGQNPGAGNQFSVSPNKAAGAPAVGGSFPRSFLIPGTDTSIRIGGQITEIIDYFLQGGNPNSSPQSSTVGTNGQALSIPLNGTLGNARGNGIFWQTPRESKLNIETRTPTPLGEARTVLEFDFAGSTSFSPGGNNPTAISDNLAPRLRYAYGTLGGFLAGQATSNFSDPDANAEVLDFGGNVGEPGHVRVPQIRYTMPVWWGTSFSVSAETSETVIGTASGVIGSDGGANATTTTTPTTTCSGPTSTTLTCTTSAVSGNIAFGTNPAKTTAPDLTMAWYIPQQWGHVDFSGVVRPGMDVEDGKYLARDFVGYGGHIGFNVRPGWLGWSKDNFTMHFVAGTGIGSYLNASSNVSLASNMTNTTVPTASAAAASLIRVKQVPEWGGEIGYQHWWMDNLRTNINGGINYAQIPGNIVGAGQAAALNKRLISAHANLIWNPVSFVDVGLEYTWAQRTVVNNQRGQMQVLISKLAFRF
jgi:hypothetical protein